MTTTENTAGNMPARSTDAETIAALRERPALRLDECCQLVAISRSTLIRSIRSGDLAAHKVGRSVYVPTPALLALVGAAPAGES